MRHNGRWAALLTAAALLSGMAMPVNAAEAVILSSDFEDGVGGWMGFGPADVSVTNNLSHEGQNCLYIGGRTENWQGAFCSLEGLVSAGNTYSFQAYVNCKEGDTVQMMLKYTDGEGEQYKEIGSAQGSWEKISASYAIPKDVKDILVYFQTAEGSNDFQVDDVTVSGNTSWSGDILEEVPLKDRYANYFKVGCASTASELMPSMAKEVILHHFNSLTIGNELKPDAVLDQTATLASGSNTRAAISLNKASSLLSFCEQNNISIRGHVLVWHSQTPDWFFREGFQNNGAYVSKDIMRERMENYIKDVFGRISAEYPDLDVYCWDVVNECYLDKGQLRPAGTDTDHDESRWSMVYGDDSYIDDAFTFARKYAPAGTKLFYNDFNEYIPEKRDAIFNKVSSLKEKGIIDGVGMQSHLDVGFPDASLYRQAIDKYDSLGLEVQITELDITDYDSADKGSTVANAYSKIMKEIVDAKDNGANITAVVFWGITDGTSWRKEGEPLLLDANYAPKAAFYSVLNAVTGGQTGPTEEPTEGPTEGVTDGYFRAKTGDVYVDDEVDVKDIIWMTKYLLGQEESVLGNPGYIPLELVKGNPWDVMMDSECDVYDLALLKRLVLYGSIETGDQIIPLPVILD